MIPTATYEEIKAGIKEINENKKRDVLTKKQLIFLEQKLFQGLVIKEGKCAKCPRTENLTLDHIIPKDMLRNFGIDIEREMIEGNYQLLCSPCNHFKSGRLDFSIPETKEILIKLLERV